MGKYLKVFTLSFRYAIFGVKGLVGLALFLLCCLLIFANLWELIAARGKLTMMNSSELMWYIAFNQWMLISVPRTERVIEGDLRSGRLVYQLPRPISYVGYVFAEAMGKLCAHLIVMGAVSYLFTVLYVGSLHIGIWGWSLALITGLLAGVLGVLCKIAMGLLAFWLHDVDPVAWIYEKLLFALGGLIMPLSAYPKLIEKAAYFTPFPVLLGGRSADIVSASHTGWIFGALFLWMGLITLLIVWLYRKGVKIVNIGGG